MLLMRYQQNLFNHKIDFLFVYTYEGGRVGKNVLHNEYHTRNAAKVLSDGGFLFTNL